MESIFQAKYINYKIQVQSPENKVSYEGPVRNIDEKIQDIAKSLTGLIIPIANIKNWLKEERLHFTIQIRKFSSEEDRTIFESENHKSKKPLNKKFKSDYTE